MDYGKITGETVRVISVTDWVADPGESPRQKLDITMIYNVVETRRRFMTCNCALIVIWEVFFFSYVS